MASATQAQKQQGWGSRKVSGFTRSKKFIKECERTFAEVDLDKSGPRATG